MYRVWASMGHYKTEQEAIERLGIAKESLGDSIIIKKINKGMDKEQRLWAKQFKGTISDFLEQARKRNFTDKSISYWVKYNWNIDLNKRSK